MKLQTSDRGDYARLKVVLEQASLTATEDPNRELQGRILYLSDANSSELSSLLQKNNLVIKLPTNQVPKGLEEEHLQGNHCKKSPADCFSLYDRDTTALRQVQGETLLQFFGDSASLNSEFLKTLAIGPNTTTVTEVAVG